MCVIDVRPPQVFGRASLKKRQTAREQKQNHKYVLEFAHFKDVQFAAHHQHALKLLPEAMNYSAKCLVFAVSLPRPVSIRLPSIVLCTVLTLCLPRLRPARPNYVCLRSTMSLVFLLLSNPLSCHFSLVRSKLSLSLTVHHHLLLRLFSLSLYKCECILFSNMDVVNPQIYSGFLVIVTYVVNSLWQSLAPQVLDVVKDTVVLILISKGSRILARTMRDNNSDMENLVNGFGALKTTFVRLSIMFTVTGATQLVSQLVQDFKG